MTMSIGLARIINDPDATVLTRKALGALSNPVLVVTDKGLTIDNDGLLALRLKSGGGLTEDADGLSATASSACFTETVCIDVSTIGPATTRTINGDPFVPVHDAHLLLEHDEDYFARLTVDSTGYLTIDASGSGLAFPGGGWSGGGINLHTGPYNGVRINDSAAIHKIYTVTSPRSFLLNGTPQWFNFSVDGVRTNGDAAFVSPDAFPSIGITGWSALVTADDVIQVRVTTANTGGSSNSVFWRVTVISFRSQ